MQTQDRPLGLGIIGCGTIGDRMLSAWRPHMKGARVVALADVNPEQVARFKDKFGALSGFADYQEMLGQPDVDAVLVLTPNHLHAEHTIAATAAGKHVCCQKPLANSTHDARRMIDAAKEQRVILMAAFVKRFWPYYARAKRLLDQGALGRLLCVRSQFSHSGIGKYYVPASRWFDDFEKVGGGPLADLGVHHFDVMRWLAGDEARTVSGDITLIDGNGGLENNASVSIQFANGVLAQGFYSFTTVAPPGVTIERMELYGTTGTVIVTLAHPGRVTVQYCAEAGPAAELGGWVDVPVTEPVPAFALMLQHFVDRLAAGEAPVTTGEDGLRSVEIVESAYRSAKEGRRMTIEDAPGRRPASAQVQQPMDVASNA